MSTNNASLRYIPHDVFQLYRAIIRCFTCRCNTNLHCLLTSVPFVVLSALVIPFQNIKIIPLYFSLSRNTVACLMVGELFFDKSKKTVLVYHSHVQLGYDLMSGSERCSYCEDGATTGTKRVRALDSRHWMFFFPRVI
jgi:hypothetical protein